MRKKTRTKKGSKSEKRRKIDKILVPIDGSKNSLRAFDIALFLAKTHKANVTGVAIIDLQSVLEYSVLDPISKRLEKRATRLLKKAKDTASNKRVTFCGEIVKGRTGPSIVKIAQKGKFDLIVMGARGLGSFSGIVLGSVSNFVIQKSKLPVLIVK